MTRAFWVACLVLCAACRGSAQPASAPTGDPAQPPATTVLIISHTTGFRHSSIGLAETTITAIGTRSGMFKVKYCRNADDVAKMLTAPALKEVQAVFFANTTGDLGFPDLDGFFAWVKAGGGVLGAHSASDTYHNEPRYIDMLGGEFQIHGNQSTADITVENPAHPAAAGLGPKLQFFDEIYHFTANNRGRVTTLFSLDRAPDDGLAGAKQPADMPISWAKTYGTGRVFYTALGHREDVWQDARFQTHLEGAVKWVLGL